MAVATLEEVTRAEARVAELMGVINAATASLVAVIAEVDATGVWKGFGIRSLEHWVTWRCGLSPARAARLVAMARRREELPAATEAFGAGELSEDQAQVVYGRVGPENDANITELARHATVTQLRRTIPRPPPPEPTERRAPVSRDEVAFGWRENGRWWCRAELAADLGAVVEKALVRSRDAEFALRGLDGEDPAAREQVGWVDALLRLAETNLAEAAGSGRPGDRYHPCPTRCGAT